MFFKREYRGTREIAYTGTLFLNDDEQGKIAFEARAKVIEISIILVPDEEDKPTIDIKNTAGRISMKFNGWNHQQAYSAIDPMVIYKHPGFSLSFAVMNTYLDGTNKLEIQFYVE